MSTGPGSAVGVGDSPPPPPDGGAPPPPPLSPLSPLSPPDGRVRLVVGLRLLPCGCLPSCRFLGLALHPLVGLTRPAFLFFLDQIAELGLGVGAGLLVLGMLLVRRLLGRGDLLGQLRRRVALVLERRLLGGEVSDGLIELVGGGGTFAERHSREMVALQVVGELGRCREHRTETVAASTDERAHGHLAQLAAQFRDLGLLGGDPLLGLGDLGVEALLLVDRLDVLLGEDVRLLLEILELVGDPFDLGPLVVDRVSSGGERKGDRQHSHGQRHDHAPRYPMAVAVHDGSAI